MVRWRLIEIVPGSIPIAEEQAVAGAFRHMVTSIDRELQKPLAACVSMRLAAGDHLPSELLDDVMAAHPGLKWVSECRYKDRRYYAAGRQVPLLSCAASPWPPTSRYLVKVACRVHWGPLDGSLVAFDVRRSSIGMLDVIDGGVIAYE
jgi:hypothetical protein